MKDKKTDLTIGVLWKQILLFSFPLIISNLLQVLFNISDIAVVGSFSGPIALGAVGSTATLVTLFTGILIGLSAGINVLVALAIGSNNKKDIKETIHTSTILSLIIGAILMIIGILYSRDILILLHTKKEFINGATSYLKIYFVGLPALALYNSGNAVLSAVGETKKPLTYLSISGVLNVVLNLIFVIGLDIHVYGVALASVISQYLSAFLILRALVQSKDSFALCKKDLKLTKDKVIRILKLGIPAGLQSAIFCIANLFVQLGINSFNATIVAGNSAAANADALVYGIMNSFYIACGSFMGQNIGAKKNDRVKTSYLLCITYSFGVGLIIGGLLVIFGPQFLSLFTHEHNVVEAGMERLVIMGMSYCVSAFMDCTIAASRALGKAMIPTIVVILGSCVFRVVWIYTVFAHYKTTTSLYLLYICSWTITSIAEMIYFAHVYQEHMKETYCYR